MRVDNGFDPLLIPSQKADFVQYGGLIRDVYLRVRPENFIQYVSVTPSDVSAKGALTQVSVDVEHHASREGRLIAALVSPEGAVVAQQEQKLQKGRGLETVTFDFPRLKNLPCGHLKRLRFMKWLFRWWIGTGLLSTVTKNGMATAGMN